MSQDCLWEPIEYTHISQASVGDRSVTSGSPKASIVLGLLLNDVGHRFSGTALTEENKDKLCSLSGFLVYNRNRLIKAFYRIGVLAEDNMLGAGVVGVVTESYLQARTIVYCILKWCAVIG